MLWHGGQNAYFSLSFELFSLTILYFYLEKKNPNGKATPFSTFRCILQPSKLHRCHRLQAATCLSVGQFDQIHQPPPPSQSSTSAIGWEVKMVTG